MLSRYAFFGGRRRKGRRDGEDEAFVDQFGASLFTIVTAVAALNMLDAFFTILFLSHGGRELNPVVQLSLDAGVWAFIWLKSIGIGICLLFLTVTKNFRFARIGLGLIFAGYMALLGWHGYLYTWLPH